MTEQPAPAGVDLARQALASYKATAKTAPSTRPPKARSRRPIRGERRDPAGLGSVLATVSGELGWQESMRGGDLLEQWPALCPQYVGRVQAVTFDATRGCLELRPSSPAYATQLRLLGGQLCRQINDKLGQDVVRSVRVLQVGALTTVESSSRPAAVTTAAAAEPGPVKTRDTASTGYQEALAAIQCAATQPVDPAVLSAIQQQARNAAREPETAFAVAVAAMQDLAPASAYQGEEIRQAAIARKYGAARRPVRTLFGAA